MVALSGAQLAFDLEPAKPALMPQPPQAHPAEAVSYTIEVRRSGRRSLGIEVHADLRVIARAPWRCPETTINEFLASRRGWIARQLQHFQLRTPPRQVPGFGDGDTHYYLGQACRLQLDPATRGVVLAGSTLTVGGRHCGDQQRVASALDAWYRVAARKVFTELLQRWITHPRFARYPLPVLKIRRMRTRWGSFSKGRGVTLNLELIHAPLAAIEYVVVHELCHYRYHGHGPGFYGLMDAVLPDWRPRKALLEGRQPAWRSPAASAEDEGLS